MNHLSHRGPDGRDSLDRDQVAMGHWHFWTTPEEVGEHQPLRIPDLPYTIVMDGRLDNRSDLIHLLDLDSAEASLLSDANLALRAYAHWGEDCFSRFIGEFSMVIYDPINHEVICARDPMGNRTMFYQD